jgi:hypothetical protein
VAGEVNTGVFLRRILRMKRRVSRKEKKEVSGDGDFAEKGEG